MDTATAKKPTPEKQTSDSNTKLPLNRGRGVREEVDELEQEIQGWRTSVLVHGVRSA